MYLPSERRCDISCMIFRGRGYLPCLLILLPRYLIAISVEYPFPNQGVIFISKRVLIKIETNET